MIRPFMPQDTEAVLKLWLDASLQAHAFVPADYWHARLADMRGHYLPLAETLVFAEEDSGSVVGFLSFIDSFVAGLFVAPTAQGQGIGSRLLDVMLHIHPDADLTVYAQNRRAVRFYARRAFVVREVRSEKATGCKEYCMVHTPTLPLRRR